VEIWDKNTEKGDQVVVLFNFWGVIFLVTLGVSNCVLSFLNLAF
jgi:hypothetical protein